MLVPRARPSAATLSPRPLSPPWPVLDGLLVASDAGADDAFGSAVDIDGRWMVVGAPAEDDGGSDAGAVYVFRHDGTGWTQEAKLTASFGAGGDAFGTSVGISGGRIAVGAPGSDAVGSDAGAVYLFERNFGGAGAWGEVGTLNPSAGSNGFRYGEAVALDGDRLAVGAPGAASGAGRIYLHERNHTGADFWGLLVQRAASDASPGAGLGSALALDGSRLLAGAPSAGGVGRAYLFEREFGGAANWGERAKLSPGDGAGGDRFGAAVALDAGRALVGAPDHDALATDAGAIYLFERNQGGAELWHKRSKHTASDGAAGDGFGSAVALDAGSALVGAPGHDGAGSDAGALYLLSRNLGGADGWGELSQKPTMGSGAGDGLGHAVALDQRAVGAGAPGSDVAAVDAGALLAGEREGTLWQQRAQPTPLDSDPGDRLGHSIAIDGDTLVVGAWSDSEVAAQAGAAYVFERNQGGAEGWQQVAKLTAADGALGDYFGWSVDVSGDRVIVGAYSHDTVPLGNEGAAYIFERNQGGANSWGQSAKLVAPVPEGGASFGWSVALDGDRALVGEPQANQGAFDAGAAHVFELGGGSWSHVHTIIPTSPLMQAIFGNAVDLDGDRAIVGAWQHSAAGTDAGAAFLFERNLGGADNWGQRLQFAPGDTTTEDYFGSQVVIDGDTAAVSADYDDDAGAESGSVYIFERNLGGADNWGLRTKLTASDGGMEDYFGLGLALRGDRLVVGAPGADVGQLDTGAAYVFERHLGGSHAWGERQILSLPAPQASAQFGTAVTIDGAQLAVGAETAGSGSSGESYLFRLEALPDMALGKSVSSATPLPGQPLTYTLTFTNVGLGPATGLVITDVVPVTVTVGSIASNVPITDTDPGVGYVWSVGKIDPGQVGTITIAGTVDPALTAPESVVNHATLSAPLDQSATNNSASASFTPTFPVVSLAQGGYQKSESGGSAVISVVLDRPNPHAATSVAFETANGTANAGEDYEAASGRLTVPAGSTSRNLAITLLDDELAEPDETFQLSISAPIAGVVGAPTATTITILNDDVPGISLDRSSATVAEPSGSQSVLVTLDTQPRASVVVGLSASGGECDVSPGSVTLTAANWSSGVSFEISAVDDEIDDGAQACTIVTAPATSGDPDYSGLDPADVTVTVQDDDSAGIDITPTSVTVEEDGPDASYAVVLTSQPTSAVTVIIAPDGQVATSAAQLLFNASNWATPQRVTVSAVDDRDYEASPHAGAIAHSLSSADSNYQGMAAPTVQVDITDNDPPTGRIMVPLLLK